MKDAVDILNKRIAELEADLAMRAKQLGVACEKHDLTHALACGRCLHEVAAENEELRKDAERWRKHGPILIGIIEELMDEAADLGTLGEGAKLRINEAIDTAIDGK